jgi:hypothetical protein
MVIKKKFQDKKATYLSLDAMASLPLAVLSLSP